MLIDRLIHIGMGANSHFELHDVAAFTTTGATVTIRVPFREVTFFSAIFLGTVASDEILSVTNTLQGSTVNNGEYCFLEATAGNGYVDIVVTRTGASKTSGAKVMWICKGKP